MSNSCFARPICITCEGHAIEASNRRSGDDLTLLLNIALLVSSVQEAKEGDDTVEYAADIHSIGVSKVVDIALPEEFLDFQKCGFRIEIFVGRARDSGVGD